MEISSMAQYDDQAIQRFIEDANSRGGIFGDGFCSVVAVKTNEGLEIVRLQLIVGRRNPSTRSEWFGRIYAGTFMISSTHKTCEQYIHELLGGHLHTPDEIMTLVPGDSYGTASMGELPEDTRETVGQRIFVLSLFLHHHRHALGFQSGVDWELRSCSRPYDGLNDLLREMGLAQQAAQVQAILPPAVLVTGNSRIENGAAQVELFLAEGLERADCRLGYRVLQRASHVVVDRGTISSDSIQWVEDPSGSSIGRAAIAAKAGDVVHCYAQYQQQVQHKWWVEDPQVPHNLRRGILQLYDDRLTTTTDFLSRRPKRGRSRDLEAGVSWLLWLSGFASVHFGDSGAITDGPDVVAVSSEGNVLIVECTTGGLKTDGKLQALSDRLLEMREHLAMEGESQVRVIAILATSRSAEEIAIDRADYDRRGILVLAFEDLERMLDRLVAHLSSDAIFEELVGEIDRRRAALTRKEQEVESAVGAIKKMETGLRRLDDGFH